MPNERRVRRPFNSFRNRQGSPSAEAWAFAYDDVTAIGGQRSHAIHVEFWSKGMAAPAMLVQRYQPMTDRPVSGSLASPSFGWRRSPPAAIGDPRSHGTFARA